MLADYHVHTAFSDDSVYPMEKVIRDAISMGLDEICITDHVDYGVKQDWSLEYRHIRFRNIGIFSGGIPWTLSFFPSTRWIIRNSGLRIFSEVVLSRNITNDITKKCWR